MTRVALCAAVVFLVAPRVGFARPEEVTQEKRRAAARAAVSWLEDHLLTLPEVEGTPKKAFAYATAGLVFLMAEPTRDHAGPLPRIVSYLDGWLRHLGERIDDPEELPPSMGAFASWYAVQYTWPAAQSLIFFSELSARGLYPKETRRALTLCEEILVAAQHENGGWGHHQVNPRDTSKDTRRNRLPAGFGDAAKGYASTLVSSTSTVAAALGVQCALQKRRESAVTTAALRYFRTAQLENGNFPYDPSQRSALSDMTGVSRAGGALLALYWLGVPRDDPQVERTLAFVNAHRDYLSEAHGSPALNLMQSAWGLKLYDAESWEAFRATYLPRILAHQTEDGDLTCVCEKKAFATTCDSDGRIGPLVGATDRAYVTALHAFILLLEDERLLIARKRPRAAPATPATTPSTRSHR